ncbi:MAG TPA: MazG nucleotide pyrophosphohydrolase domain-containing protein [Candidatus Hydrogenedentes bacterium]|nr:MazG nucleotide pyrophosphohydrolase domain-containing protein [Candidatus Hydrogenedentota bacterium]
MPEPTVCGAAVPIPHDLPEPFKTAWRVQADAARAGFDWDHVSGVTEKIHEEIAEIEEALGRSARVEAAAELGDLLFTAVNLARFLGVDPARELAAAARRFQHRFARLEAEVDGSRRVVTDYQPAELDAIWQRIKRSGGLCGTGNNQPLDKGADDGANSLP